MLQVSRGSISGAGAITRAPGHQSGAHFRPKQGHSVTSARCSRTEMTG